MDKGSIAIVEELQTLHENEVATISEEEMSYWPKVRIVNQTKVDRKNYKENIDELGASAKRTAIKKIHDIIGFRMSKLGRSVYCTPEILNTIGCWSGANQDNRYKELEDQLLNNYDIDNLYPLVCQSVECVFTWTCIVAFNCVSGQHGGNPFLIRQHNSMIDMKFIKDTSGGFPTWRDIDRDLLEMTSIDKKTEAISAHTSDYLKGVMLWLEMIPTPIAHMEVEIFTAPETLERTREKYNGMYRLAFRCHHGVPPLALDNKADGLDANGIPLQPNGEPPA